MPTSYSWSLRRAILYLLVAGFVLVGSACAKRSHQIAQANDQQPIVSSTPQQKRRIDINTASAKELEALPGIGKSLAERIVEHRDRYGAFRRPAHLIVLRGISDRRFRALRDLITVE